MLGIFFEHISAKLGNTMMRQPLTGSDEEQAMTNAMEVAFPGGGRLSCTRHLKGNMDN